MVRDFLSDGSACARMSHFCQMILVIPQRCLKLSLNRLVHIFSLKNSPGMRPTFFRITCSGGKVLMAQKCSLISARSTHITQSTLRRNCDSLPETILITQYLRHRYLVLGTAMVVAVQQMKWCNALNFLQMSAEFRECVLARHPIFLQKYMKRLETLLPHGWGRCISKNIAAP